MIFEFHMYELLEWSCQKLSGLNIESVPDTHCEQKTWQKYVKCECSKTDQLKIVFFIKI